MAFFATIIHAETQRQNELIIYYNIMNDLVMISEKEIINVAMPEIGTLEERVASIIAILSEELLEKINKVEKTQEIKINDIVTALLGTTIPPQPK